MYIRVYILLSFLLLYNNIFLITIEEERSYHIHNNATDTDIEEVIPSSNTNQRFLQMISKHKLPKIRFKPYEKKNSIKKKCEGNESAGNNDSSLLNEGNNLNNYNINNNHLGIESLSYNISINDTNFDLKNTLAVEELIDNAIEFLNSDNQLSIENNIEPLEINEENETIVNNMFPEILLESDFLEEDSSVTLEENNVPNLLTCTNFNGENNDLIENMSYMISSNENNRNVKVLELNHSEFNENKSERTQSSNYGFSHNHFIDKSIKEINYNNFDITNNTREVFFPSCSHYEQNHISIQNFNNEFMHIELNQKNCWHAGVIKDKGEDSFSKQEVNLSNEISMSQKGSNASRNNNDSGMSKDNLNKDKEIHTYKLLSQMHNLLELFDIKKNIDDNHINSCIIAICKQIKEPFGEKYFGYHLNEKCGVKNLLHLLLIYRKKGNDLRKCKNMLDILESSEFLNFYVLIFTLSVSEDYRKGIQYLRKKIDRKKCYFSHEVTPTDEYTFNQYMKKFIRGKSKYMMEIQNTELRLMYDLLTSIYFASYKETNLSVDANIKKYSTEAYNRMRELSHSFLDILRVMGKIQKNERGLHKQMYSNLKIKYQNDLAHTEKSIVVIKDYIRVELRKICEHDENFILLAFENVGKSIIKRLLIKNTHAIETVIMVQSFYKILKFLETQMNHYHIEYCKDNKHEARLTNESSQKFTYFILTYTQYHLFLFILQLQATFLVNMFYLTDQYFNVIELKERNELSAEYFTNANEVHELFNILDIFLKHAYEQNNSKCIELFHLAEHINTHTIKLMKKYNSLDNNKRNNNIENTLSSIQLIKTIHSLYEEFFNKASFTTIPTPTPI